MTVDGSTCRSVLGQHIANGPASTSPGSFLLSVCVCECVNEWEKPCKVLWIKALCKCSHFPFNELLTTLYTCSSNTSAQGEHSHECVCICALPERHLFQS